MIAGLLLAAGGSRRFGSPKLLQELHAKPLVRWSADALKAAALTELIVVVPPRHDDLAAALAGTGARLVVNPHAERGMGTSLAAGVDAVSAGAQAVLIALADSPPPREVLLRVVERYRDGGASIVAPDYRGVFAPPVLFDRAVFSELCALTGDEGARVVVEREPDRVARIDVEQDPPADVDTPEDLARLRRDAHFSRTISPRQP